MADEDQQQDHAMGGQVEAEVIIQDLTPAGLYRRLQAGLSKAENNFKEDTEDEASGVVDELIAVLSDKFEHNHLTKEEGLFYGALLQVQWIQSVREEGIKQDCEKVIDAHLAMTFNSNASSSNVTAFLSYCSLLLALYYRYVEVDPVENELTLLGHSDQEAYNLVRQWTGLNIGPLQYADGRYQVQSVPVAFSRNEIVEEEKELVSYFDTRRSAAHTRERLREAYNRISGDIANSQQVWSLYHQFEVSHLSSSPSPDDIERLQSLYFARLRTPHAQIEETLQSYSTFVTKHLPTNEYEKAMLDANKLVGSAREAWSSCEQYETQLSNQLRSLGATGYARWAAWKGYISWSSVSFLHPHQKKSGTKSHLDLESVCAIYERAIASCGLPPSCTEQMLAKDGKPLTKSQMVSLQVKNESREAKAERRAREEEQLKSEREASLDLWKRYLIFLASAKAPASVIKDVCSRASKAIPSAGLLHAQILRTYCRLRMNKSQIDEYFGATLNIDGIASDSTSIVELVLAWIDVHREMAAGDILLQGSASDLTEAVGKLPLDTDAFMDLYSRMTFALSVLEERSIVDEGLRLEHLTSEWCLRGGDETAGLAETIWEKAVYIQSGNSLAWLGASRYYRERRIYKKSRSLLRLALGKKDLTSDKKVGIAEELLKFEHVFGGIVEIDWTIQKLDSERERSWNEYYAAYMIPQEKEQQQSSMTAEAAPEVDMSDGMVKSDKRRADEDVVRQPSSHSTSAHTDKRGREGDLKTVRDRENSSVMVDSLPLDATQDDLITLFKDCGEIREFTGPKVVRGATDSSALVEFTSRESIPTVRSRHHKMIRSHPVEIYLGWECTLYITNFAPEYDSDEKMRQLFDPFGKIFDIRWPSKKFANSRRFCYVQYCNSQSAQSALTLHEMEMINGETGEEIKMQVLVSNPLRKSTRSDAQSNDRELFITGLPRAVEEAELKEMFGQEVEGVRIPKHPDGRNKGIAFVDMKTTLDAQAALGHAREVEGGLRIKGKLISVNLADKGKGSGGKSSTTAAQSSGNNNNSKSDNLTGIEKKNHQIKVRGLPLDAQEAVIQQVFEAHSGSGSVKRVEWTPGETGRGIAIVEFHDVAVAGRISLMPLIMYDESHPLQMGSLDSRGAAATLATTTESSGSAPFAPRQALRGRGRGRGGLGYGRRAPVSKEHQAASTDGEMEVDTNVAAPRKTQDSFREMLKKGK